VLALATYGVATVLCLLKGGRRGLIGFACWRLLLFAVEFSTVRLQEPFVLYRAYLWVPPLFLLVPALTCAVPDKFFWPAILVAAVAFSVASSDRLKSFSSSHALWDDAVLKLPSEQAPGSARAYNNRGLQNMQRGDIQAAIADFTSALRVDPEYKLAYGVAPCLYEQGGTWPNTGRGNGCSAVSERPSNQILLVRSIGARANSTKQWLILKLPVNEVCLWRVLNSMRPRPLPGRGGAP